MRKEEFNGIHAMIFHAYGQGVGKKVIFHCAADKRRFLFFIEKFAKRFGIVVYAFVLMSNHFHLLLSGEIKSITTFLRFLHNAYSGYFSSKYGEGEKTIYYPIKASAKTSLSMTIDILLYILDNPVDARLSKSAGDYKWSSYLYYTEKNSSLKSLITVDASIVRENYKSIEDLKRALEIKLESMKELKRFKYGGHRRL